jgi:hypothetical protein
MLPCRGTGGSLFISRKLLKYYLGPQCSSGSPAPPPPHAWGGGRYCLLPGKELYFRSKYTAWCRALRTPPFYIDITYLFSHLPLSSFYLPLYLCERGRLRELFPFGLSLFKTQSKGFFAFCVFLTLLPLSYISFILMRLRSSLYF